MILRLIGICMLFLSFTTFNYERGDIIDSYNNIPIYYNGKSLTNVSGRNLAKNGYNLGLKYQCVEFVKRYYYEHYNHYMPYSYGHAKDFFDNSLTDKDFNVERGLLQFRNVRYEKPKEGDILIYGPYRGNPFGHIGIITEVGENYIEIIQQNVGLKTRQKLKLVEFQGIYTVADYFILGWLRMPY